MFRRCWQHWRTLTFHLRHSQLISPLLLLLRLNSRSTPLTRRRIPRRGILAPRRKVKGTRNRPSLRPHPTGWERSRSRACCKTEMARSTTGVPPPLSVRWAESQGSRKTKTALLPTPSFRVTTDNGGSATRRTQGEVWTRTHRHNLSHHLHPRLPLRHPSLQIWNLGPPQEIHPKGRLPGRRPNIPRNRGVKIKFVLISRRTDSSRTMRSGRIFCSGR